ncbi:oligosaccharyltransferase subunit [Talaromyces pinophilus]|uniref:Oligosaccharyltransferase subunit n=1 Tax=Talaromyces pinophilus TaxID=128442 RepID=A0A6V8HAF9_TALPI|nr:oligosaccharyltransferase subunit [Talaromyces pinophilus]
MRLPAHLSLLALVAPSVYAASWGFTDATVSVSSKSATGRVKESLKENKPLSTPISLGDSDSLKLLLTTQEDRSAKRPHQAFLLLKDSTTGLDVSYPFSVKNDGKSKVELSKKDIPTQFIATSEPVDAEIVIGSFGASDAYRNLAFQLSITSDASAPVASDAVERYGKQPRINHIFKADPKSPPPIITLIFLLSTLVTIPVLAGMWMYFDVNLDHLSVALKAAPIPHIVFVSSVIGLEGIFFMYYTSWTLFQMLPASLIVGAVAFLSGSRALSEKMGATASKPARSAASAASRRQYPKTASPGTTKATPTPINKSPSKQEAGPTYHSKEQASASRSEAIDLDARDPHFAASLRSIGPVTPNPTFSHSSTFNQSRTFPPQYQPQTTPSVSQSGGGVTPSVFPDANNNPALLVLSSRSRITKAAEQELESFGRPSHPGREYLDAMTIRQVLSMRDRQKLRDSDIERTLRLKKGVVRRLGEKGVVSEAL